MELVKATKKKSKLRMALIGPSGSGKTYSSLLVASHLPGPIGVIDTEHGSAAKYADEFEFFEPPADLAMKNYSPEEYIRVMCLMEDKVGTLIVDGISHAWMGRGGCLEQVDHYAARERGNSFGAWRHVTPQHNALIDAMLSCKCHLIVTMRSKTEWVIDENERGKKVPRKIGTAPVQRDGLEYEFDVVGDMDAENNLFITKSRCKAISGLNINKPGESLASALKGWLTDGVDAPVKTAAPANNGTNAPPPSNVPPQNPMIEEFNRFCMDQVSAQPDRFPNVNKIRDHLAPHLERLGYGDRDKFRKCTDPAVFDELRKHVVPPTTVSV